MQHYISVALVLFVSAACFFFADLIGYKVVALLLLVTVSLLAMLFDILPVLVAAVLSAVIWNFFFIPPLYTFHIDNAEDVLMFLLYFVIALVNAVLTFNIRAAEKKVRDKEEKEHTIKLYNTLLNSLSHEMRTPLSAIIGSVDLLKENSQSLSAKNRGDLLDQIEMASMRLNHQVENLLGMSRLETGMLQLKLDWCDVNELVYSVIRKLEATTHNHNIIFEPDENLPLFKLDRGLMEQVIDNLIRNGIQHTPDHSTIRIAADYKADTCRVTVADNGRGFPENETALVFEKFYRLPDAKPGGTGLGLSIAKGFTEAHGGELLLENAPEGGAKFAVVIPAKTTFINHLKNE